MSNYTLRDSYRPDMLKHLNQVYASRDALHAFP